MSIFDLSRRKKTALMIIADIIFVSLSLWMAFSLRLGVWFLPNNYQVWLFVIGPVLALPVFIKFGLYRAIVRYIEQKGLLAIFMASGVFVLLWLLVGLFLPAIRLGSGQGIPRSIPILYWMILILTVGGSRLAARWLLLNPAKIDPRRNVLIYGANRLLCIVMKAESTRSF